MCVLTASTFTSRRSVRRRVAASQYRRARAGVRAYTDYNNESLPSGPNRLPLLMAALVQKHIRAQGFIILDHYGDR
jgi:NADPH-dependent curcumin reductase CurA